MQLERALPSRAAGLISLHALLHVSGAQKDKAIQPLACLCGILSLAGCSTCFLPVTCGSEGYRVELLRPMQGPGCIPGKEGGTEDVLQGPPQVSSACCSHSE